MKYLWGIILTIIAIVLLALQLPVSVKAADTTTTTTPTTTTTTTYPPTTTDTTSTTSTSLPTTTPAFPGAWAGVNNIFVYATPEDSFTVHEVTGTEGWYIRAGSGEGLNPLTVTLNSTRQFSSMYASPASATNFNPPEYQWYFGASPEVGVYVFSPSKNFTPGFDVAREITPRVLTVSGDQILSVTITPKEAFNLLDILTTVEPENDMFSPQIISASVSPGSLFHISGSGQSIQIFSPVIGQPYTCTITLHVELKEGVNSIEYIPNVIVQQQNTITQRAVTGSEVSESVNDLGDCTWTTTGIYTWTVGQQLSKMIELRPVITTSPPLPTTSTTIIPTSTSSLPTPSSQTTSPLTTTITTTITTTATYTPGGIFSSCSPNKTETQSSLGDGIMWGSLGTILVGSYVVAKKRKNKK